MNCKPGEVAMIVRNSTRHRCLDHLVGTPIETTVPYPHARFDAPLWQYKGRYLRCACGNEVEALLDRDLQPMRPKPEGRETVRSILVEATA